MVVWKRRLKIQELWKLARSVVTSIGMFHADEHFSTKPAVSNHTLSANGSNGQEPTLSDILSKVVRYMTVSFLSVIICRDWLTSIFIPTVFPCLLFVIPLPLSLYFTITFKQLHHPSPCITLFPFSHPFHSSNRHFLLQILSTAHWLLLQVWQQVDTSRM